MAETEGVRLDRVHLPTHRTGAGFCGLCGQHVIYSVRDAGVVHNSYPGSTEAIETFFRWRQPLGKLGADLFAVLVEHHAAAEKWVSLATVVSDLGQRGHEIEQERLYKIAADRRNWGRIDVDNDNAEGASLRIIRDPR